MMLMMPNVRPLLLKKVRYDPSILPETGLFAALITKWFHTCTVTTTTVTTTADNHEMHALYTDDSYMLNIGMAVTM